MGLLARLTRLRWLLALCLLLCSLSAVAATRQAQPLAEGTAWQTHYVTIDSGESGPTVMVIGGVHGDEPAGARAAEQIADWPIQTGRLVVVPRASVLGLKAGTRRTPDQDGKPVDLNRAFPAGGKPEHPLAQAMMELVKAEEPDWLIDLHEGFDFHQQNPKSVGASVIFTRGETKTDRMVRAMLDKVNATIEQENRRLVELGRSGPIHGSLANAAEELGIRAMILETSKKDQRLPVRIRQHRVMVHELLTRLGVIDEAVVDRIAPASSDQPIIAVFDDLGVGASGKNRVEELMRQVGCVTRRVDGEDIRAGVLTQFDLLVCSGGSGSKQAGSLQASGREKVKDFVRDGGGYVGICAGAYLSTANYTWSLGIVDAKTLHKGKQWRRGTGKVQLEWTGQEPAVAKGTDSVYYANGPILGPAGRDDLKDYTVLAWFRTEITKNDAEPGLMINTPAIITGEYGQGRVLTISPHPESTKGLGTAVQQMILWVTESE